MHRDRKIYVIILGLFVSLSAPAPSAAQGSGGKQQGGQGPGNQGGGNQGGGNQGGGNQKGQGGLNNPTQSGSNAPFESQMMAYAATDHIAAAIAAKACDNLDTGKVAVIYDPTAFSSLLAYTAFEQQATMLVNAYKALAEELDVDFAQAQTASLATAQTVVGILAQLATASNTENASTIAIADITLQTKIAQELLTHCKIPEAQANSGGVVAVPQGQPPPQPLRTKVPVVIAPQFGVAIHEYLGTDDEEEAKKQIEAKISAVLGMKTSASKALKDAQKADTPGADYKELNGLFDSFIQATFGTNATTGMPQYSMIVQGYVLNQLLKTKTTIVVFEQVLAAGGTARDRKNLFTSLTVGGPHQLQRRRSRRRGYTPEQVRYSSVFTHTLLGGTPLPRSVRARAES
jgi:hypothetical protein